MPDRLRQILCMWVPRSGYGIVDALYPDMILFSL